MKKTLYTFSIIFLFLLQSCVEDEEMTSTATIDLASEASIESSFEDVDIITEAGMSALVSSGREMTDRILDCAMVTKDTLAKMVTIDFGESCEGPNGRIRSGKIIISYSDRRYVPGATRVVTFDGFQVDSVAVQGTRTMTNISTADDVNPTFQIIVSGGKLTFSDGTSITRDSDHVRTWYREESPTEDYATLTGNASGINRDGLSYSATIMEALVFKRACRGGNIVIPVEGVKTFMLGENSAVIDYGDGTCDAVVTVTTNGVSTTKTITPRGRRFRRG